MASVKLGTKAVGSIVKLNESGSPVEFVVAHQDSPSGAYSGFEGGTLLVRKDIYSSRQWNAKYYGANDYADSGIHSFLNNTYLGLLDTDIQAAVKQIRIPYRPGGGDSTTVYSGSSGLLCKAFLLSMREVGLTNSYAPQEGVTLDWFSTAGNTARIAYSGSYASRWWLRTPSLVSSGNYVFMVTNSGNLDNEIVDNSYGVRPAFVLDGELSVSDDGTVSVNQPPTAPGSIDVTNVTAGQQATITLTAATDEDGTVVNYIYERQVDGGSWTQFASANSLTQTDTISGDWGTVAYRAKAVDDDGAEGPYATSTTETVNTGWIIIGGPASNMGEKPIPFSLEFTVDVSDQTSVSGISVSVAKDSDDPCTVSRDAGSTIVYYVDTRLLGAGEHTIAVQASKDDYLPASAIYTFTVPAITLPDGGKAEQPQNSNGDPVWWYGLGRYIIGKDGKDIDYWIERFAASLFGGGGGSGGGSSAAAPIVKQAPPSGSFQLQSGTVYDFSQSAASALTLTFAAAAAGRAATYHVIFKSGTTATTLNLPETVLKPDGFVIEAGRIYELSILENLLTYQSWEATT